MATKLISSIIKRPADDTEARQQRHTTRALASLWGSFLAGALCGAMLTFHFPAWGLAGMLVPLACAWLAAPKG